MKANVQKLIGTAVLGLAMLLNGLPTWAGAKDTPEVTVAPNFAEGSMVGARYSADSQQYIGCSFENRSGPSVVCFAQDKTGKNYVCYKNDATWATAVKSINDFSFLRFGGTAIGSCDSLTVENSSRRLK
jgi:hypothetical protein